MGLKVGMSTVRDRIGLPDPDEDEELLQPAAAAPSPFNLGGALNARGAKKDAPSVHVDRLERATNAVVSELVGKIKEAVESAASLEDLQEKLRALAPELDGGELAKVMAEALAAAAVAGRFDIMEQAGMTR
jgi:phage gp29-like protein